jgi:endonuclease/exonuclease/phosphatase family metal-dependent hydrolase
MFGRSHEAAALLVALFAVAACSADAGDSAEDQSSALDGRTERPRPTTTTRLRVVASNLTSGDAQSYDPGEGIRILQALAPDVALVQEFSYGNDKPEDLRAFVDQAFGTEFSYTREPRGQIPNGVVSRYPIVESGNWDDPETNTREFAYARIDVPGDKDVWAVSMHLLTSNGAERQKEATALVTKIRAVVPEGDYVVIGGDFNTGSRGEAAIRTLGQLFRTTGPYPVDSSGNGNTNASRREPYDWVLADRELDPLEVPVTVGTFTFPNGLVFDSRVFRPIADVPPVRTGDSAARNMQHMAVVRDFALPL